MKKTLVIGYTAFCSGVALLFVLAIMFRLAGVPL